MKLEWSKYTLKFKQQAGTSRGVLRTKDSYFLKLSEGGETGWGECGLLRGLSADDRPDYEARLNWLKENIHLAPFELYGSLREFPSIQFGLEMALRDLEVKGHEFFPSAFTKGEKGQAINGLIWMGDRRFMRDQIQARLDEGFSVLKMKIGAIDLETELALLSSLRQEFSAVQLSIRVDANGAFQTETILPVLDALAKLAVHSIEQPIKAGQWQEIAALCEKSPLSIALDEELIGVFDLAHRTQLLKTIKPHYLILKPSFIGGWRGSDEWVELAKDHNIDWWVTSALESNYGLSAIAQWNYTKKNNIPSGLGTGSLYLNNLASPLVVRKGTLYCDQNQNWNLSAIEK